MYTHKSIREGSIVKATGSIGDTYYKVLQVGTRYGGLDSFLGLDLREYPCKQIVSCGSIKEVRVY